MQFKLFFCFVTTAGGLAFAAPFYPELLLHWFATVVVAIYAIVLFTYSHKTKDIHTQHPESVYIVGYIATIAGFAGLAVFLGKEADQFQDFKNLLHIILTRGGCAVVSTLVGLVAMNLLKIQADGHSSPKTEQDDFIEKLSGQFATKFNDSLATLEQTAGLSQVLTQATAVLPVMNQLSSQAQEVERVMVDASQQMPQLVQCMARFEELTKNVLPAWEKLSNQAVEAAKLNTALANSAVAMESVQISANASAKAIGSFAQSLPELQGKFTELLSHVQVKLDSLNQFGDELTRFLQYAHEAGPVLTSLRNGFGDVTGIGEDLKLVSRNLAEMNNQLLAFNGGAITLTQTSGDFGRNIGTLSVQISTAMLELARLTEPMKRIGEMAEKATTVSAWFSDHNNGVADFTNNLKDLVATSEALKGAVGYTTEAVTSSTKSIKELQELMPKLATARMVQLEKL